MMKLEQLTPAERFIVEWQYRMLGGFRSALIDAISRADEGNLMRLRRGFPDEVEGYLRFSREDGWWESVQQKAMTPQVTP